MYYEGINEFPLNKKEVSLLIQELKYLLTNYSQWFLFKILLSNIYFQKIKIYNYPLKYHLLKSLQVTSSLIVFIHKCKMHTLTKIDQLIYHISHLNLSKAYRYRSSVNWHKCCSTLLLDDDLNANCFDQVRHTDDWHKWLSNAGLSSFLLYC